MLLAEEGMHKRVMERMHRPFWGDNTIRLGQDMRGKKRRREAKLERRGGSGQKEASCQADEFSTRAQEKDFFFQNRENDSIFLGRGEKLSRHRV